MSAKAPEDKYQAKSSATNEPKASDHALVPVETEPNEAKAKPKLSRRRRWLRRFVILCGVVVVFRIALWLMLPILLNAVLAPFGLTGRYERLDLSILGGDIELWQFELSATDDHRLYLVTEYGRIDLSVLDLFRGRLVVRRIEADGVDFYLTRRADGTVPFLEHFASNQAAPAEGTDFDAADIDIDPPVEINSIRLQFARFHIDDQAVSPPLDARLDAQLRLTDFRHPTRPTLFDVELFSPRILESVRITGKSKQSQQRTDAEFDALLAGLNLEPLERYLEALGLSVYANELSGTVRGKLELTRPDPDSLRAAVTLDNTQFLVDSEPSCTLAAARLAVVFAGRTLELEQATANGGRVFVERNEKGAVRFAGIEIGAAKNAATTTGGTATPASDATSERAASAQASTTSIEPNTTAPTKGGFRIGIAPQARVDISDCVVEFEDHARPLLEKAQTRQPTPMPPTPTTLHVELTSCRLTPAASGFGADPLNEYDVDVQATIPGVAERMRVRGTAAAGKHRWKTAVNLSGKRIHAAAIQGYLDDLGIQSDLDRGRFGCHVELDLSSDERAWHLAALAEGIELVDLAADGSDGDVIFKVEQLAARGIHLDTDHRTLQVEALICEQPATEVRRDAEGIWHAFGIAIAPTLGNGQVIERAPLRKPKEEHAARPLRDIQLERRLAKRPWILGQPWHVSIDRIRCNADNVRFDDRLADTKVELDRLEFTTKNLSFGSERPVSGRVEFELAVPSIVEVARFEATINAQGMQSALRGRAEARGLTVQALRPYLDSADIQGGFENANCSFDVAIDLDLEHAVAANLRAEHFQLKEAEHEPCIAFDRIDFSGVRARPGAIELGTIVVDKPTATLERIAEDRIEFAGFAIPVRPAPKVEEDQLRLDAILDVALPELPTSVMKLDRLEVSGAELDYDDKVSDLRGAIEFGMRLADVDTVGHDPAQLDVELRIPGIVDRVHVAGDVMLSPEGASVGLDGAATGINGQAISKWLPKSISSAMTAGSASGRIEALVAPHESGGHRLSATIRDVVYSDGETEHFALADAGLEIARWDTAAQVYQIANVYARGLRARAARREGALTIAGFRIGTAAPDSVAKPEAPVRAATRRLRPLLSRQPSLELDKLAIEIDDLRWTDDRSRAPLVLSNVALTLDGGPWHVEPSGSDDRDAPTLAFKLEGTAEPIAKRFEVATRLDPLALQAHAAIAIHVDGIDGAGLDSVVPTIIDGVETRGLEAATFDSQLDVTMTSRRRSPYEIDLRRPLEFDAEVGSTSLTTGDGALLAGVHAVHIDRLGLNAKTGAVRVRSIDVDTPGGRVERTADAIVVLGLAIPIAGETQAAAQATTEIAVTASKTEATLLASPKNGSAKAPVAAPPDVLISQVNVRGIEFDIADFTGKEACSLPLRVLDLNLRNVSLRPSAARPIRLAALIGSGEEKFGEGVREWLPELTIDAELTSLAPPMGYLRAHLDALDLCAFESPAAALGLSVSDGKLDSLIDVQLRSNDSIALSTRFVFANLDMSESEGGPIESVLKLPMSLQPAIFLIRDSTGAIHVPISVNVDRDGLSTTQLVSTLTTMGSRVIGNAIANSPLRVGGTVTDWVGLTGDEEALAEPLHFDYRAGQVIITGKQLRELDRWLVRAKATSQSLVTLSHSLGATDIDIIRQRTKPEPALATTLLASLEGRRERLRSARQEQAAAARESTLAGLYALGDRARAALRQTDRQLGRLELAIDRLLDRSAADSEGAVTRRLREGALLLAEQRLQALLGYMVEHGIPRERIRLRRPRLSDVSFGDPEHGESEIEMRRSRLQ